ncbi:MAG: hypothetical protein ACFHU9_07170 [Fluviicola sp.]
MKFTFSKQFIIAGIIGVLFVVTLLIIAFTIECPTEFQNQIFKIIMALSAGAFAVMIPGAISINYKGVVSASGAIAVFVMVYFFSPSTPLDSSRCEQVITLNGFVTVSGKPAGDVDIIVGQTDQVGHSNKVGKFSLVLANTNFGDALTLYCRSDKNGIDTIVYVAKNELSGQVNIRLNKGNVTPEVKYRGNVYLDGNPLENATVTIPQLQKEIVTDQYGFFDVLPENRIIDRAIKMIIRHDPERINESIDLPESELIAYAAINVTPFEDTTAESPRVRVVNPIKPAALVNPNGSESIVLAGKEMTSPRLEEHCLVCMQFDAKGTPKNIKEKCKNDLKYLQDYMAGYKKASEEQGLKFSCKFRTSGNATLDLTPQTKGK